MRAWKPRTTEMRRVGKSSPLPAFLLVLGRMLPTDDPLFCSARAIGTREETGRIGTSSCRAIADVVGGGSRGQKRGPRIAQDWLAPDLRWPIQRYKTWRWVGLPL
jgi:hypothetical protein